MGGLSNGLGWPCLVVRFPFLSSQVRALFLRTAGRIRFADVRAGQVYQVKVVGIDTPNGLFDGLKVGGIYAMKILIPPSRRSRFFRNALYWIGFQGPFQLQVNPPAARAGALWQ